MTDDQILARLGGPPDLGEGIESLAYWRARRRRLAWYRIRPRREAARMIARWEQRVRDALVSQRGVAIETRLSAGLLLAQIALRRWTRRIAVAVTAFVLAALVAAPIVAAIALISRAF